MEQYYGYGYQLILNMILSIFSVWVHTIPSIFQLRGAMFRPFFSVGHRIPSNFSVQGVQNPVQFFRPIFSLDKLLRPIFPSNFFRGWSRTCSKSYPKSPSNFLVQFFMVRNERFLKEKNWTEKLDGFLGGVFWRTWEVGAWVEEWWGEHRSNPEPLQMESVWGTTTPKMIIVASFDGPEPLLPRQCPIWTNLRRLSLCVYQMYSEWAQSNIYEDSIA
jgi:hypothetical protein